MSNVLFNACYIHLVLVCRAQAGRTEEDEAQNDQQEEEGSQTVSEGGHQCNRATEGGRVHAITLKVVLHSCHYCK